MGTMEVDFAGHSFADMIFIEFGRIDNINNLIHEKKWPEPLF